MSWNYSHLVVVSVAVSSVVVVQREFPKRWPFFDLAGESGFEQFFSCASQLLSKHAAKISLSIIQYHDGKQIQFDAKQIYF